MKNFVLLAALAVLVASPPAFSQSQPTYEQVPQGIEALQASALSRTDLTLDHSMLVFASKLDADDDLQRVIAGVNGVSIHRYRYSEPGMYDPAAIQSLKDAYHASGWKQLVNKHERDGGGVTDVWLRFQNNAISNVAVLVAHPTEVTFITVSGSISPLDLFHLGGHFGIPKIEGGVTVPGPERR